IDKKDLIKDRGVSMSFDVNVDEKDSIKDRYEASKSLKISVSSVKSIRNCGILKGYGPRGG
ncbi:hypothetical protein HN873_056549, partial [Arachis hypogaea]